MYKKPKLVTLATMHNVQFPIYPVPENKYIYDEDGILTIHGRVLDDRNMSYGTLGLRRAMSPFKKELVPLRKSIKSLYGLLEYKGPHNVFIASDGKIIKYKRTKRLVIKWFLIRKVEKRETHSLVYFYKWDRPFLVTRPPPDDSFRYGICPTSNNNPIAIIGYDTTKQEERVKFL